MNPRPPTTNQQQSATKSSPIFDLTGFIIAWAAYSLLVLRFWWVCDDAFISFRYARHLALGHGLRYNLIENPPVEGYSNFLWVIICSVFEFFRLDITVWPLVLSFICGSILLYLVFTTLRYRLGMEAIISSIALLPLACSPAFAVWSTSGMETMAFSLLLFLTFDLLVLRRDGIPAIAAGICGLLLGLIRVEGIFWSLLLLIVASLSRAMSGQKYKRELLTCLLIVVIGYAGYWFWRYPYFKLPFSNTAYAKVALSSATLLRGFNYVAVQFLTLLTPFVIFPAAVSAWRRERRPLGIPLLLMVAAVVVYAIIVSGDFMGLSRLLVPGLAFNTLLFGYLVKDIADRSRIRYAAAIALGLALALIGLLPGWDINPVPESVRAAFHFRYMAPRYRSEYKHWKFEKGFAKTWTMLGIALQDYARPDDRLVHDFIGATGYYSDLFIYDQCGLVTRKVTEQKANGRPLQSPGHDKCVSAEFFLPDKPTLIFAEVLPQPKMLKQIRSIQESNLNDQYIADFRPLPEFDEAGDRYYLVVSRRIPEGADPKTAHTELQVRLRSLPLK